MKLQDLKLTKNEMEAALRGYGFTNNELYLYLSYGELCAQAQLDKVVKHIGEED